jgi:tail-anchored protein insertion receptor
MWNQVFDRKAYAAFIKARSELRQARLALSSISAQDEFAKWAKQRRLVDRLTGEFDSTNSKRNMSHGMAVFVLTWSFKIVTYLVLLFINMKYVNESVMPVPKDVIVNDLAIKILAFPYSPIGAVSAFAWANIVHQAARQLFVKY